MHCPRCGNTNIIEWSPGYYRCENNSIPDGTARIQTPVPGMPIVIGVQGGQPVFAPGPIQGFVDRTVGVTRSHTWRWHVPTDRYKEQGSCHECTSVAHAHCHRCDTGVCDDHGQFERRPLRVLCRGCALVVAGEESRQRLLEIEAERERAARDAAAQQAAREARKLAAAATPLGRHRLKKLRKLQRRGMPSQKIERLRSQLGLRPGD